MATQGQQQRLDEALDRLAETNPAMVEAVRLSGVADDQLEKFGDKYIERIDAITEMVRKDPHA